MDTRDLSFSMFGKETEERGRIVKVEKGLMSLNQGYAEANRQRFAEHQVLALNILSSPGSGKTALIARTLKDMRAEFRVAVIVGDLATDNDAERIRMSGAQALQIQTGTVCHLEAAMIGRALDAFDLSKLDLLMIENVGNLVCPASYDLGEAFRVVLFSTTEGEDKPLKYPTMFKRADTVLISKLDLAEVVQFDRETALRNLHLVTPKASIFDLSAKTGQGMEGWYDELRHRFARLQSASI